MRKTVNDEHRLFYYDIRFIYDKPAQKYLKILKELGEPACLTFLIYNENNPDTTANVSDIRCMAFTSAGTRDKVFQDDMFCMVYNTDLEYFHLMGRKTVLRAFCYKCGDLRCTEDMKFDPSEGECICRHCSNPEYYMEL
jgi:hypothetical protein